MERLRRRNVPRAGWHQLCNRRGRQRLDAGRDRDGDRHHRRRTDRVRRDDRRNVGTANQSTRHLHHLDNDNNYQHDDLDNYDDVNDNHRRTENNRSGIPARPRKLLTDRCPGHVIAPWAEAPPDAPPPIVPPAPPPVQQAVPGPPAGNCHPSYPTICIPPAPPDLDCSDVSARRFTVLPPDPHGFDGNSDGVGCEG